jgi:hypothetical protein
VRGHVLAGHYRAVFVPDCSLSLSLSLWQQYARAGEGSFQLQSCLYPRIGRKDVDAAAILPDENRAAEVSGYVASEPKLSSTLTHLKPIPVRILEPCDGTPWELEDLGWLELDSARL